MRDRVFGVQQVDSETMKMMMRREAALGMGLVKRMKRTEALEPRPMRKMKATVGLERQPMRRRRRRRPLVSTECCDTS